MGRLTIRDLTIKQVGIRAEIADTTLSIMLGLMFRKPLARGTGMLLCFRRSADHAIHMWNVRFPLDVIFITQNGKVAHIHRAIPWEGNFRAGKPIRYVLEVNAGFCLRNGIRVGDRCRIPPR